MAGFDSYTLHTHGNIVEDQAPGSQLQPPESKHPIDPVNDTYFDTEDQDGSVIPATRETASVTSAVVEQDAETTHTPVTEVSSSTPGVDIPVEVPDLNASFPSTPAVPRKPVRPTENSVHPVYTRGSPMQQNAHRVCSVHNVSEGRADLHPCTLVTLVRLFFVLVTTAAGLFATWCATYLETQCPKSINFAAGTLAVFFGAATAIVPLLFPVTRVWLRKTWRYCFSAGRGRRSDVADIHEDVQMQQV